MDYKFKDLVNEAKAGSQDAQMRLLEQLKPLLHAAVKRYGWGLDSEEMLQEANAAVLEGIKAYDESKNIPFLGFIKTRIYFHVYNLSRKQRVAYSLNSMVDDEDGQEFLDLIPDDNVNLLDDLVSLEQAAILKAALSKLDYRRRQIIELHYFKGVNLKKIAQILGISYKTALRTRDRALEQLRSCIMQ